MARTAISSARTEITTQRILPIHSPYGLRYNGTSNAYTDFGSNVFFDSTKPWSVYALINLQEYFNFRQTGFNGILSFATDQGVPFILWEQNPNTIGLGFGGSSIFPAMRVSNSIAIGNQFSSGFHSIQIIFNGVDRTNISSYSLFIDGVAIPITTTTAPIATANSNTFGRLGASNSGRCFIANIIIWNGGQALTQTDAQNIHFNGIKQNAGTITHLYAFTEGSGSSVADSVGGVNGTNGASAVWKNVNRGTKTILSTARTLTS